MQLVAGVPARVREHIGDRWKEIYHEERMKTMAGKTPPSNKPKRNRKNTITFQLELKPMPIKTKPHANIKNESQYFGLSLTSSQLEGISEIAYAGKNRRRMIEYRGPVPRCKSFTMPRHLGSSDVGLVDDGKSIHNSQHRQNVEIGLPCQPTLLSRCEQRNFTLFVAKLLDMQNSWFDVLHYTEIGVLIDVHVERGNKECLSEEGGINNGSVE